MAKKKAGARKPALTKSGVQPKRHAAPATRKGAGAAGRGSAGKATGASRSGPGKLPGGNSGPGVSKAGGTSPGVAAKGAGARKGAAGKGPTGARAKETVRSSAPAPRAPTPKSKSKASPGAPAKEAPASLEHPAQGLATPASSPRLAAPRKAPAPHVHRGRRYIDELLARPVEERMTFVEEASPETLARIVDESYMADLVNVLLDLRRSLVKQVLETLRQLRKRASLEIATLFYYREYLSNPLPLRVLAEKGVWRANAYAILGVARESPDEDIKEAFKLLSRAYSTEHFPPELHSVCAERLGEITEAYELLGSEARRAETDRILPTLQYLYPKREATWLEAVRRVVE